jgi:hypothetical protein
MKFFFFNRIFKDHDTLKDSRSVLSSSKHPCFTVWQAYELVPISVRALRRRSLSCNITICSLTNIGSNRCYIKNDVVFIFNFSPLPLQSQNNKNCISAMYALCIKQVGQSVAVEILFRLLYRYFCVFCKNTMTFFSAGNL